MGLAPASLTFQSSLFTGLPFTECGGSLLSPRDLLGFLASHCREWGKPALENWVKKWGGAVKGCGQKTRKPSLCSDASPVLEGDSSSGQSDAIVDSRVQ